MSVRDEVKEVVDRLPEPQVQAVLEFVRSLRLTDAVPDEEKTEGVLSISDPDENEWMSFVATNWQAELADPREDIYSLADGEPVREAG
jgi:hypothetical protein